MYTCLPKVEGNGNLFEKIVCRVERTSVTESLRHCFLQHKSCIITTSAAKTDSHKWEMRQPEKENGASSLWNLNRRTLLISSTRLCFTAHVSPLSHVGNSCHSYCRKFVFLFWLRVPALLIKSQQCVMKCGCCFQNGRSHFNTHFVCVCVCVSVQLNKCICRAA